LSISANTLELLMKAGLEGPALLAVVRSMEADMAKVTPAVDPRIAKKREADRARMAESRATVALQSRDNDDKEKSPTPPKEITTTNLTVVSSSPPSPPIQTDDLQEAFEAWNTLAAETGIPGIQRLNDQRRKALKARLRELGGMDGWTACLEKIRAGPLLLGQAGSGWVATFDWENHGRQL